MLLIFGAIVGLIIIGIIIGLTGATSDDKENISYFQERSNRAFERDKNRYDDYFENENKIVRKSYYEPHESEGKGDYHYESSNDDSYND